MSDYRLSDLLDLTIVQKMADAHYRAAGMPIGIIDAIDGSLLVGAGWQDVCVKFHRANPVSLQRCLESDNYIKDRLVEGEACHYKCQNGLWDIGIPIVVAGRHLATMFLGQFFYEGEAPDRDFFIQLAHEFGFDVDDYLAALESVLVFSREKVDYILEYDKALVSFIADLAGHSLLKTKADEEIKSQAEFLQLMIDAMPYAVFYKDRQGRYLSCNRAFERFYGMLREQIAGKTVYEIAPKELADVYRRADDELFAHPGTQMYEGCVQSTDGVQHDVIFHKATFEGPDRTLAGLIGAVVDITDRKKAEEALREQRMIFEIILEQSLAGYWDWDFRNGTEYLSPSFKKMLGYEDHELPNDPDMWKKLIFPEDLPVVIDTFHRYIKSHGKIPYNYEVRYRHKNGSTVWVYCAGKVIEWNRQGRAARMIGCHLDITEHKKLEEELVKARNLESIGILAGGIAHDFNNLLTGVFGYISLAKQYTPKTSKAYPMLEKGELAYNEASSLTDQFISCSKGGICVEETIQPANLIRAAVSTIMSGSNIKKVFNIPDDLWSIHADTRQLAQAIGNIALNARDVMPSGGMLLVSASNAMLQPQDVAGLGAGKYIKISIRDEGCGIAPDILPKIFDPYLSTKERGTQKGMGLGLTVSYEIIKKHNGVITVESEPGKGSTFTICLPAC